LAREQDNASIVGGLPGFLGGIALVLVFGSGLLLCSARWLWLGEIAFLVRFPVGLLGLAAGIALYWGGGRVSVLFAIACASFHLAPELGMHLAPSGAAAPSEEGARVRIATCVVDPERPEPELLRAWLMVESPDIVALQGLSSAWLPALELLEVDYPWIAVEPSDPSSYSERTRGVCLLSRYEIDNYRAQAAVGGAAILDARLVVERAPLHVVVTELLDQHSPESHDERKLAFSALAEAVDWGASSVLLGQLSACEGAPLLDDFLGESRLRNSRRGFGRLPTWSPEGLPLFLGAGVDHVLVGRALTVESCRTGTGAGLGGRHRALATALRLPTPLQALASADDR